MFQPTGSLISRVFPRVPKHFVHTKDGNQETLGTEES